MAGYSVGQVARIAGVTVRTLHHYDEIGLLSPGDRTAAGYRHYGEADMERLQQLLFYRELGFSLDHIAALLDDPASDPAAHLRRQYDLLTERIDRLTAMRDAVAHSLDAHRTGNRLTLEERFEIFGTRVSDPAYGDRMQRRWAGSPVAEELRRRVGGYGKADWQRIETEAADWRRRLAEALDAGADPAGERAMDLAEELRQHVSRWFFTCTPAMQRVLADSYVTDPAALDIAIPRAEQRPGLAEFLRDAVDANASRAGDG